MLTGSTQTCTIVVLYFLFREVLKDGEVGEFYWKIIRIAGRWNCKQLWKGQTAWHWINYSEIIETKPSSPTPWDPSWECHYDK
jgi:hypothetical protein